MVIRRLTGILFRMLSILNIVLTIAIFFKVGKLEESRSGETVTPPEITHPLNEDETSTNKDANVEKMNATINRTQKEFIDYVSYVDMYFETNDWEIGADFDKELIWLEYMKFPHTLLEAQYYLGNKQFKAQWIEFTNATYRKTQDYLKELKLLGYTGDFKMLVTDPAGEIIYMASDDVWGDKLMNERGSMARGD